jgi:predicted nucleotide-binding protein
VPNLDEIRDLLAKAGYRVDDERRLPDGHATQLRLSGGVVVNVYDKGSFVVQGKRTEAMRSGWALVRTRSTAPTNVFVVYGHDPTVHGDLETLLRRWGLEPISPYQLPSEGNHHREARKVPAQAHFAVVLATPDDERYRAGRSDEKAYRPRQNVVLELGMMLAHLGRSGVAVLLKDVENMEMPSDIRGHIHSVHRLIQGRGRRPRERDGTAGLSN